MRAPTYEMFNYNFRPAKAIERKIFLDVLKEIYGVSPGLDCKYIGFGSVFFADFKMIHKELNINTMINIESNEDDKKRFEFNRPFKCIDLKWGLSTDVLPTLDWRGRSIIWMDYDDKLQISMFDDLDLIFTNSAPGSFYFFTCNSSLSKYENKETKIYEPDRFINDFDGYASPNLKPEDLIGANSPSLIRDMLIKRISRVLDDRNALKEKSERIGFSQVLNIKYRDGAAMYSFGGYIDTEENLVRLAKTNLKKLPFVRNNREMIDLRSPVITNQEIDLMNSYLPHSEKSFMTLKKLSFIPNDEKMKYFNTYRHYPYYAELRS